MTEHDVWKAAFGRHMDRGEHAGLAAAAANEAVHEYLNGPLGSAGRCENELCPSYRGGQAEQAARRPVPGVLQGVAIGAVAKGAAQNAENRGPMPDKGAVQALKTPSDALRMLRDHVAQEAAKIADAFTTSPSKPPADVLPQVAAVAKQVVKPGCLGCANAVCDECDGVTGAAIGDVAKQVAEFHEQAAAAKQPRFKFGDRVLVSPPGKQPFYDTVAQVDPHDGMIRMVDDRRWFVRGIVQHAPEVSHDQC